MELQPKDGILTMRHGHDLSVRRNRVHLQPGLVWLEVNGE